MRLLLEKEINLGGPSCFEFPLAIGHSSFVVFEEQKLQIFRLTEIFGNLQNRTQTPAETINV